MTVQISVHTWFHWTQQSPCAPCSLRTHSLWLLDSASGAEQAQEDFVAGKRACYYYITLATVWGGAVRVKLPSQASGKVREDLLSQPESPGVMRRSAPGKYAVSWGRSRSRWLPEHGLPFPPSPLGPGAHRAGVKLLIMRYTAVEGPGPSAGRGFSAPTAFGGYRWGVHSISGLQRGGAPSADPPHTLAAPSRRNSG